MVKFCRKCVISSERPSSVVEHLSKPGDVKPTIQFDDADICSACRVAEKKALVDWDEREKELRALLDLYRRNDGRYDVLVPGSGGKDSFYAAHVLKNKYGMHPLTCTWAPHIYTDWGWRNFQRFCSVADNYLLTPNVEVHRLLTRLSLENLFHPFQPFILGQKAFPPKLAKQLGIKLVFYGESPAEYGNGVKETAAQVEEKYHVVSGEIHLAGASLSEIGWRLRSKSDLTAYLPMEEKGPEVYYLGYFLRWHPQSCYYYAVQHGDFEASPERTPGTYSKYSSIDDKMDDLHYFNTWIKFGIGRATYDAAQEIRSGDITREEGIQLVRKFDGEYPERFEREVFPYLSVHGFPDMTRERLFMLADKFRSEDLWKQNKDGEWQLRHTIWDNDSGVK